MIRAQHPIKNKMETKCTPIEQFPLKLREIFRRTKELKAKHAAIRKANAALLPATLERVFAA
jgi:hypothetical protein